MKRTKQPEPITVNECMDTLRKCGNAFVMSGYRPKPDSDNPCEALLHETMSLLARWDSRYDWLGLPEGFEP